MTNHPINATEDQNLILSPFQFLYPVGNLHVKETDLHKFQKTKLSVKCKNEDYIFTFYNTLRHITASYNILLQPLEEITKATGVSYQLIEYNCIGYENAKDIISTALYLKLTGNDYFKSFPKAYTFIIAAANNSNRFRLLYRILEVIHPRLRLEKGPYIELLIHPATMT